MSEGQWKRWDAVARLTVGKLTVGEAARVLGLSVRQVRRIRRRVAEGGRAGLQHGNRGRVPVNKLRAAGVGAVRGRRPPKHRRRRDRKAQAGLMLLWDGSRHDWLEGRGPWLCLVAAIDDATGELLPGAHFVEQECAAGYLRVLRDVVATHGVPWSIYMDQHGALKRNDDHWTLAEELRGAQDPTQVGQALQALGIEAIYALSPQAKGRVERLWGTLQDRLVSELAWRAPRRPRRRTRCWRSTGRNTIGASRSPRRIGRRRGGRCARGRTSTTSAASATRRPC